ncbi:hypothetical protein BCO18430_06038 [Burkholderia contaminans]|jgi:hypothetical protein|nr:hypothetical protein BCO18430_06038 [Burkholderia contaminans]
MASPLTTNGIPLNRPLSLPNGSVYSNRLTKLP